MRYVAVLSGKELPSASGIENILSSVIGISADQEILKKLISEVNGKSIDELIKQGSEKLAAMPNGGASPAAAAAGAALLGCDAKQEDKEEEMKKEASESEDDDMEFR